MSILLVDVLKQSETKDVEKWIPKLTILFSKITPTVAERDTYLTNAIRWSTLGNKHGHPLLHQVIGQYK